MFHLIWPRLTRWNPVKLLSSFGPSGPFWPLWTLLTPVGLNWPQLATVSCFWLCLVPFDTFQPLLAPLRPVTPLSAPFSPFWPLWAPFGNMTQFNLRSCSQQELCYKNVLVIFIAVKSFRNIPGNAQTYINIFVLEPIYFNKRGHKTQMLKRGIILGRFVEKLVAPGHLVPRRIWG